MGIYRSDRNQAARQFNFGAILMGGIAMDGARPDTPPDDTEDDLFRVQGVLCLRFKPVHKHPDNRVVCLRVAVANVIATSRGHH